MCEYCYCCCSLSLQTIGKSLYLFLPLGHFWCPHPLSPRHSIDCCLHILYNWAISVHSLMSYSHVWFGWPLALGAIHLAIYDCMRQGCWFSGDKPLHLSSSLISGSYSPIASLIMWTIASFVTLCHHVTARICLKYCISKSCSLFLDWMSTSHCCFCSVELPLSQSVLYQSCAFSASSTMQFSILYQKSPWNQGSHDAPPSVGFLYFSPRIRAFVIFSAVLVLLLKPACPSVSMPSAFDFSLLLRTLRLDLASGWLGWWLCNCCISVGLLSLKVVIAAIL